MIIVDITINDDLYVMLLHEIHFEDKLMIFLFRIDVRMYELLVRMIFDER